MIVDAHQHFWDPARGDYGWLTPDNPIHRVFSTADLRPLLIRSGVEATILVQAAPTLGAGGGGLDRPSPARRCR
jgi:L-fuconolactonase